ncbi:ATP-dependent helicase [Gammaproteobacteria bacterium]|nr:ATP-dependent helicase [Gammaproteobacteria bacterium]
MTNSRIQILHSKLALTQTHLRFNFFNKLKNIKLKNKALAGSSNSEPSNTESLNSESYALKIKNINAEIDDLEIKVAASIAAVALKLHNFPKRNYDLNLPVSQSKDIILKAIKENQVIILCGETGSGKTTQIAKICMDLGLGSRGMIGHTQPRRIAARSVAVRVAQELAVEIGGVVGFKMRFSDQTKPETLIKLMTDGILLAELTSDRYLSRYEVLIIDEAHERSLNIDFLLGVLKQVLIKRPDLKVIITSATIDPIRFSNHFGNNTPVVEVSGRTYPVEIRYRPLLSQESKNQESKDQDHKIPLTIHFTEAILAAVDELWLASSMHQSGDILIFLSGEREIRETAEALRKHHPPHVEILPLYARLSANEQQRIFKTTGARRIVLATNVAETSLTVPGIKYVIDTGLARISRYNPRTRLQRLPVEAISRASANQRSGRCGRTSNGICIRLYAQEDFEGRAEFLAPEITRTHLAAVVLQMAHLRLGDPTIFPFVEAPDTRQIKDAYRSLFEIKAVDSQNNLTVLGKQLARLPLDPRLGAMLLSANTYGVLHEVLILVSVLSIQDPRERPLEFQQKADEKQRLFHNPQSDFISILNLWAWYQNQAKHLSHNQLRQLAQAHFLSFMRMREWRDLYQQLLGFLNEMDFKVNSFPEITSIINDDNHNSDNHSNSNNTYQFPAFNEMAIHKSLLTGLLDQIGRLNENSEYLGANNRKFILFPGSALRKKTPKWLIAMEIVETNQIYARTCAAIDPLWIEECSTHLIKTNYSEAHWSKSGGMVKAYANLSLFGLAIVNARPIHYGPINPTLSRELLIKDGLITGEIKLRAHFLKHNQLKILEVTVLEEKMRRRDILVDEWILYQWYDQKIPQDMITAAGLDKWCQHKEHNDLLKLELKDLLARDPNLENADYPTQITLNNLNLSALYVFDPSAADDGMTLIVPLAALNLLDKSRLDWLVPGFLLNKIIALIRSLPKSVRRHLVPAPDFAAQALANLEFGEGLFYEKLALVLSKLSKYEINMHDFDSTQIEAHLHINLRIADHNGKTIGEGRNLHQLQDSFKEKAQNAFSALLKQKHLEPVSKTLDKTLSKKDKYNQSVNHNHNHNLEHEHEHKNENKNEASLEHSFELNAWLIEKSLSFTRNGVQLTGFPSLVLEHTGDDLLTLKDVRLKKIILDQAHLADAALKITLSKLAHLMLIDKIKYLTKQWPNFGKMALMFRAVGTEGLLKADLMRAVILDCVLCEPLPRDAAQFQIRITRANNEMIIHASKLSNIIIETLTNLSSARKELHNLHSSNLHLLENDINKHIKNLIFDGFVSATPSEWRMHLPRYMKALEIRITRFSQNIERDKDYQNIINLHLEQYNAACKRIEIRTLDIPELIKYRYLIEELAVSFFAQPMKTALPVSEKRLTALWLSIDKQIKNLE